MQLPKVGFCIKIYNTLPDMKNIRSFVAIFILSLSTAFGQQYVTNGNATQTGSCYRLTSDQNFQGGSVWYLDKININESFDLYFDIFLGCKDADGADGIAFVLQPVSTNIGSAGGGMGYQGISPSVAIEMDTWQNVDVQDPLYDHIGVQLNGNTAHGPGGGSAVGPLPILPGNGNIEDCNWHSMRVTWDANLNTLSAFIDCNLAISYTDDIVTNIFGGDSLVFWGFTGATGGFNNTQEFCLDYISFREAQRDTAICEGQTVPLSVGTGDVFAWTPSYGLNDTTLANPIASPDTTTTYSVIVTDVCGQIRYDTVTVFVSPDTILDVLPPTTEMCGVGIPLEITAQTDPFSQFLWSTGDTTAVTTVTQPGNYTITVTNFCRTYTDNVQVSVRQDPSFLSQDVDCFGDTNGAANFTNTGGSPYSAIWYSLTNATIVSSQTKNSPVFLQNGLEPGIYALTAQNGNGCGDTITFQINEPAPLTMQVLLAGDLLCFGDNSGEINVLGAGGTGVLSYSLDGGGFQPSGVFANLPAGTYAVTVRDINGCLSTQNVTLTQPQQIDLQISNVLDIDCFGAATGAVTLSASNGFFPYQYSIGGPFQASPTFTGLSLGNYPVTVRDVNGCESAVLIVMGQPNQLVSTTEVVNVDCAGDLTGAISVTATGGTAGYLYSFQGSPFGAQPSVSGLAGGTYQVIVQDNNLCEDTIQVLIQQPVALDFTADITDALCFGDTNGLALLTGLGGWGGYRYSLNGGPFITNDSIQNLSAGTYQITIQDDSLCVNTQPITIGEPTLLEIAVTNASNVDCLGNASGSISVVANGGTPGYEYTRVGIGFQPSSVFDNLFAGLYTLTVRDDNGCLAEADTFLVTPTGLTGGADTIINVACFGDSTGEILLTAFGGTAPYRYALNGDTITGASFFNLPFMTDTLVLLDDNGCIVPIPFTIDEPPLLVLNLETSKDLACNGVSDGEITLQAVGGVPVYQYSVGTGFQNSRFFTGLPAGLYATILEDQNGCRDTISVPLTEPGALVLDSLLVRQVRCFGEGNGEIQLNASGGSGAYQFQIDTTGWDLPSGFAGLSGGNYLVQVRDDSLCIDSFRVNISEPDSLMLSPVSQRDLACFGGNTGELAVMASGGRMPWAFRINGGAFQSDSSFAGLLSGQHLVEVQDDSLCSDTVSFFLSQPEPLDMSLEALVNVRCFGEGNGEISVSASGGVLPYGFSLSGGAFQRDSILASLEPGEYRITLQDDSACVFELNNLLVTQPDLLETFPDFQEVRCFGEENAIAWTNTVGGNGGNMIEWFTDPIQIGDTAIGLIAGSYGVRIEDSLGCEAVSEVIVTEPDLLVAAIDSIREAFCDWENGAAWLSATGGTPEYLFEWIPSTNQNGPSAVDIVGLVYEVVLRDSRGCEDSIVVDIPNTPPADTRFTTIPDPSVPILESVGEIQFDNQTIGAVSYLWEFGDGGLSDEEQPVHLYEEPGEYTITLTAWNSFFVCPTIFSLRLTIIPDGKLYYPNAFTPNGDGNNDIFYVKGEGVIELEVLIFDRWGRFITSWTNLDQGWDGIVPGKGYAQEGVYTFAVKALTTNGERIEHGGTVTLLK